MSVAEALGLMIVFASLLVNVIFGILAEVKKDKKSNRLKSFRRLRLLFLKAKEVAV